jgi:CHRD domain
MRRFLVPTVILVAVASLLALTTGVGSAGAGGKGHHPRDVARFSNNLAGREEVPPADLDGEGRAKVTLNTKTGEVCFRLRFSSTGTPNRGHIHVGDTGANGGIAIAFFELVDQPADPRNDDLEEGRFADCVSADPSLVKQIAEDPTGYYVNLHNARFPGGAVRCQLVDA